MLLKNRYFRLLPLIATLIVLLLVQMFLFARAPTPWLACDVVTIFVGFVAAEHSITESLIVSMFAAICLQVFSAVPAGFFVMYYLMLVVLEVLLSKRFIVKNPISQAMVFALILSLKSFLFYFVLVSKGKPVQFGAFMRMEFPSFAATALLSVPCFIALSRIESHFQIPLAHDRKSLSDLSEEF